MNKLNLSLVAISALAMTACSSEEPAVNPGNGGTDGVVSFTLSMPGNFGSRAVADGLSATELNYAVFDEDGEFLFQEDAAATFASKQTTVQIPLVIGKKYQIAFFAKSPSAPYTITDGVVTLNYSEAEANNDAYDAFYQKVDVNVTAGMEQQSATLTRPFAQVNIGATDWKAAKKAGYVVESTGLSFTSEVYTTFNLIDGTAADEKEITFAHATLPDYANDTPAALVVEDTPYDYMAMAYVLPAAGDKSLVSTVTFSYQGPDKQYDVEVNAVPVQTNHRTNILGRFFTTDVDYKIVIDEAFDEPDYVVEIKAETAEDFTNAINSPVKAKIIVEESLDLTESDASGLKLNNDKEIEMADEAQLTLPATGEYIDANGHNLTINGGTITNAAAEGTASYAKSRAGEDMTGQSKSLIHITDGVLSLKGVTLVNDMNHHWHGSTFNSAAIAYWGNCDITIDDCKIYSGEFALCGMGRGVNSSKLEINNSYFESTSSNIHNGKNWAYCIRLFGSEATLNNCEVKGVQGALSTEELTCTINGGKYYTYNNEGKTDAHYAVYATNASKVIINSGDFYTPNKHTGLNIEGTSCVVSGDNDVNLPLGSFVEINGGRFSGKAYVGSRLCDEFNWVETSDPENPLIKWTIGE